MAGAKIVAAELRADVAGLRGDLASAAAAFNQFSQKVDRIGQQAAERGKKQSKAWGAGSFRERFGGMGDTAKAVAVGGAFYGVTSEIKQVRDYEKALVDLAVSGGETGSYIERMRKGVELASNTYDIAKEDILSFAQEIVSATGDTALAESQIKNLSKVAYASGADIKDLANVMVQLQNVVKIPMSDANEAFGVLIEQAQKGSFELKDMAKLLPEMIIYMDSFGLSGKKAMGEFTALLQIAKRGTGSAEEAATATRRMFDAIMNKRGAIEKTLGIKLKRDGKYIDMGEMIQTIAEGIAGASDAGKKVTRQGKLISGKAWNAKNAKDMEAWMNATFDIRGSKLMRLLVAQAKTGWSTKMGNYETYQSLSQATGTGAVDTMAASRRNLSKGTGEWTKATNQLRNQMHTALLPVVKNLSGAFESLGPLMKIVIDNWGKLAIIMGAWKGYGVILNLMAARQAAAAAATTANSAATAAQAATMKKASLIGFGAIGILGAAIMIAMNWKGIKEWYDKETSGTVSAMSAEDIKAAEMGVGNVASGSGYKMQYISPADAEARYGGYAWMRTRMDSVRRSMGYDVAANAADAAMSAALANRGGGAGYGALDKDVAAMSAQREALRASILRGMPAQYAKTSAEELGAVDPRLAQLNYQIEKSGEQSRILKAVEAAIKTQTEMLAAMTKEVSREAKYWAGKNKGAPR